MLRRILYGLMTSIASPAVVLLALEVGLRMLGVGNDAYVRPHPWTGWVLIPGLRASVQRAGPALGRRLELRPNSLGLRGLERSNVKPPGLYRVLVLGDSHVMAHQVPFDSALTRRLERALDGRNRRRVEVWNCGVDGYTTSQELLYLRHVAGRFQPDLVVLGFFAGNDVGDQVPDLATSLRGRPFFRLEAGELVLDRSHLNFRTRLLDWLRTRTRLFDWANTRRRVLLAKLGRGIPEDRGRPGLPAPLRLYAEPPDTASHPVDRAPQLLRTRPGRAPDRRAHRGAPGRPCRRRRLERFRSSAAADPCRSRGDTGKIVYCVYGPWSPNASRAYAPS